MVHVVAQHRTGEKPIAAHMSFNRVIIGLYNGCCRFRHYLRHWWLLINHIPRRRVHMMTSSNGNIFRVTGHLCARNSPVPGEFPTQRPVTRSFDILFDLRLNKRLSKQSWGWWLETLSHPLWGHRNAMKNIVINPFSLTILYLVKCVMCSCVRVRYRQRQHRMNCDQPFTCKCKNVFPIYIIPPRWHNTGSWNPSSCKTRTYLLYIVNIMGVDILASQAARASATMILAMLNQTNSVPGR